jgi:hypothetical protein
MNVYKTACWFGNQYFLGRYRKNTEEVNLNWFIMICVVVWKGPEMCHPNEQPLDAYFYHRCEPVLPQTNAYSFHQAYSYRTDERDNLLSPLDAPSSEVLLLLEELCEANNSAVDEQAPNDRHGHGRHRDEGTVCK